GRNHGRKSPTQESWMSLAEADGSAQGQCACKRGASLAAGKGGIDAGDELVELGHVIGEEVLSAFIGHRTIVGDQIGREVDIGLNGVHLWRIAEAQYAAKVLLGDGGTDRSNGCADD